MEVVPLLTSNMIWIVATNPLDESTVASEDDIFRASSLASETCFSYQTLELSLGWKIVQYIRPPPLHFASYEQSSKRESEETESIMQISANFIPIL